MWLLVFYFSVAVSSQCIRRDAVKDALAEQRLLENIRPILDSYISDSLERDKKTIENLEQKVRSLETQSRGGKATVFTRWGRTDCPLNKTTMVYSGYAGGSHYSHSGAAAEYICMPPDPIWGPNKDVSNGLHAYIYGAEYQSYNLFGVLSTASDEQHTTSLMIPSRTECYPGWTEAYRGDLAAGNAGHEAASQYVCVDENAMFLTRSNPDSVG